MSLTLSSCSLSKNKNNSNNNNNSGSGSSSTTPVVAAKTLSCVRNMTVNELATVNDAISGTVSVSVEFDNNDAFESISLVKSVVYADDDAVSNEPVEMEVHEAEVADLTTSSAVLFSLPSKDSGELDLSYDRVLSNYESLDFTCEAL